MVAGLEFISRRVLVLALMLVGVVDLSGCAPQRTYVLVHGAWADASSWDRVRPLLEKEGQKVVVVELPAHGSDTTAVAEASLQGYTDKVVQVLDAQQGPVILVGHSMGGTVISQAAEQRPEKISKLVYLAAYLLRNGESLYQISQTDTESKLGAHIVPEQGGSILALKPEAMTDAFCQDCSAADAEQLRAKLKSEPTAPLGTPVTVTEERWGKVPRVYIKTTQDRTVGPALQERMYTASPVERVLSLDSGHAPFLTKPEELTRHLLSL
jgi:pimeloyl-ACP methyl ester carboxylesterase